MGFNKCSYLNCMYRSNERNMFRFPVNNRRRLNEWLENCGNRELAHLSVKNLYHRYICIVHFDKKFIQNVGGKRKRISKLAVPRPYRITSNTPSPDPNSRDSLDLLYEEHMFFIAQKPSKCYLLKRKRTKQIPPKLEDALVKQRRLEAQRDTADIDLPKICKDYQRLPSPVSTIPSNIQQSSIIHYHNDYRDTLLECFNVQDSTQECDDVQESTQKCDDVQESTQKCDDVQESTQKCDNVQDSSLECDDDQSEINMCRICLQSFSKLISLESYGLRTAYEQVTGVSVEHDDGLPRELCVECATLLDKYHRFRDKAIKGNQLLRQIYSKGGLTETLPLEDMDQAISSLASNIDFSPEVTCIEIKPTNTNYKILVNNPARAVENLDINSVNAEEDLDINSVNAEEDLDINSVNAKEDLDINSVNAEKDLDINSVNAVENPENSPDNSVADLDMVVHDEEDLKSEASMNECPLPTEENYFELEMPLSIKQEEVSDNETDPLMSQSQNSYSKTENYENKLLNDHCVIKRLNNPAQKVFHSTKQMEVEYTSSLYQCQSCYDGFRSLDELKEHGFFHSMDRGNVVCGICKLRFSHKIELRAHTQEMHLYSFCCIICDQTLHTRQSALNHLRKHL